MYARMLQSTLHDHGHTGAAPAQRLWQGQLPDAYQRHATATRVGGQQCSVGTRTTVSPDRLITT